MADIKQITLPSGNTYDLKDGNAIANITRSGTTFTATRRDGTTFTFTQRDNNTTYESKTAASDGTDVSLVTTGEKYIWNNKTSNTGTVTKIATGAGLTGGDVTTTGTIKANLKSETKLTNDSVAVTEVANRVYPVALDKSGKLAVNVPWNSGTDTTYSAGTGLSMSETTLNHSNSVTAGTAGTSSATSGSTLAVPYVTYDAQGHITASGTHTHTISGFLTSSSSLNAAKLTGTVPTSSLPSYVDDVLEYTSNDNFPATGETGKIYVNTTTNLTYRWGGSSYVEISPSLALGSTASTAAKGNHTHTVTATGSVSTTTASTENKTAAVSSTTGTATYTPGGTVSQPSFTGTAATINSSASYTPAGSISVNSAGSTTTVNSITAVGSLPTFSTSVSNEVMSFSFSQGTLPTKGSNTTVKTGDASYKFAGTAATISSSGSYTPAGTVSQPTFTGTGVRLVTGNIAVPKTYTSTFTGTSATTSVPA